MRSYTLIHAFGHLRVEWGLTDTEAMTTLGLAMHDGTYTEWSGPGGVQVTYDKDTARFTLTGVTRQQFYVFRSKIGGTVKIWAEYFQGEEGDDNYLHTVLPVCARTKKHAVKLLSEMYPDAVVLPLLTSRDKRRARVYVHMFAGRAIPEDFPWEDMEDVFGSPVVDSITL